MSAPLKSVEGAGDLTSVMAGIGRNARAASRVLALAPAAQKSATLARMAAELRADTKRILAANADDLAEAQKNGVSGAFLDRLTLNDSRIEAMASGIEVIRDLADPVGTVMDAWTRPNGLKIERVRVPLGVIGIVYESRPNVTADAGALCLKAGNAAILRGGSDSARSSRAIHAPLQKGLREAGLPEAAIQPVPPRDRAAGGVMLSGLDGNNDVAVPPR